MIIAHINGRTAYPATTGSIRITLDNPFVKDSEERTMEVVFPMDIQENRAVFGSVNRLDTGFASESIDNCALIADNVELIRGIGTITAVTPTEVRLQILAGKSSARYKAVTEHIFIDAIDYGPVEQRHAIVGQSVYQIGSGEDFTAEYRSQGFVGETGRYAFLPFHDTTNDRCWNMPMPLDGEDPCQSLSLLPRAVVMPNLMLVMRKVMEAIGYTVSRNVFDVLPWNRLYIVGRKRTTILGAALPHWKVATFLDEFRKLFNAAYLFNEAAHTVAIVPFSQADQMGTVSVEPAGDFETSFDEDGLEYLGASNLEYELPPDMPATSCITEEMRQAFTYAEYDSYAAMQTAWQAMTLRERLTCILRCPQGFFYGSPMDSGGEAMLMRCGWFTPLIRQTGGSSVTLRMVPAAVSGMTVISQAAKSIDIIDWAARTVRHTWKPLREVRLWAALPDTDFETVAEDDLSEEAGQEMLDYTTVADVFDGAELPSREEDSQTMQLVFAAHATIATPIYWDEQKQDVMMPGVYVNSPDGVTQGSLALNIFEGSNCIGQFHNPTFRIRRPVDGNNEVRIPFLFDGKPDPKKVYVIRNRRYLCAKIDLTVTDGSIDRLMTGFFHELL